MTIKIIKVFKDSEEKLRFWLTSKIAKVTDIGKYNLYLYGVIVLIGENNCFASRRLRVRVPLAPFWFCSIMENVDRYFNSYVTHLLSYQDFGSNPDKVVSNAPIAQMARAAD